MATTRPGRGSRSGRTIAVAGAVVAAGAAALMTAGVAAAAPGRCAVDVDVRAEPSTDAGVVAVCEAGTAVPTGRVGDGFELTDLDDRAAAESVEVDGRRVGAAGGTPAPGTGSAQDPAEDRVDGRTDDEDAEPPTRPGARPDPADDGGPATTTEPYDDPLSAAAATTTDDDRPAPAPAPMPDPLGGPP